MIEEDGDKHIASKDEAGEDSKGIAGFSTEGGLARASAAAECGGKAATLRALKEDDGDQEKGNQDEYGDREADSPIRKFKRESWVHKTFRFRKLREEV
jgi:hypothetical protein